MLNKSSISECGMNHVCSHTYSALPRDQRKLTIDKISNNTAGCLRLRLGCDWSRYRTVLLYRIVHTSLSRRGFYHENLLLVGFNLIPDKSVKSRCDTPPLVQSSSHHPPSPSNKKMIAIELNFDKVSIWNCSQFGEKG